VSVLIFCIIWYFLGIIPLIICVELDYYRGKAITVKQIAESFLFASFGPVIILFFICAVVDELEIKEKFRRLGKRIVFKKEVISG